MSNNIESLDVILLARHPLIYINHYDFQTVDSIIVGAGKKAWGDDWSPAKNIIEFSPALGQVHFISKNATSLSINDDTTDSEGRVSALDSFLENFNNDVSRAEPVILLLKEIHDLISSPKTYSLLQMIAGRVKADDASGVNEFWVTVIIVDSKLVIPAEIEKLITVWDVPYLSRQEIETMIRKTVEDNDGPPVDSILMQEIVSALSGLSAYEIHQILNFIHAAAGYITRDEIYLIHQQKRQAIKKSGLLEMVDTGDINVGGLKKLTNYLNKDNAIFSNPGLAQKFNVAMPSGIMIVGMPGCGKSLTAKYVAQLFKVPLLRLDIGRLLGKYVGESEENMRRAIQIAEAASPCVLWIDEIEKAFAGVGRDEGGGGVATRLFGNFLTWMQEKKTCTYVVATANDIENMPPEFLRKGRFDEIFRVSFPNHAERVEILKIQLKKHAGQISKISEPEISELANLLPDKENFSGADIESIVSQAIKNVFVKAIPADKTQYDENNIQISLTAADVKSVINDKDTHSSFHSQEKKLAEMMKKLDDLKITPAT